MNLIKGLVPYVLLAGKKPVSGATGSALDGASALPPDHCEVCRKRVYAMESHQAEGSLFHKDCFKCVTCARKLCGGNFAKNELGFFCIPHFQQITKVTGGYKTGTGPTRNAAAASLVEAMVNREIVGHEGVVATFSAISGNKTAAPGSDETRAGQQRSDIADTGVADVISANSTVAPGNDETGIAKQTSQKADPGLETVVGAISANRPVASANSETEVAEDHSEIADSGDGAGSTKTPAGKTETEDIHEIQGDDKLVATQPIGDQTNAECPSVQDATAAA